MPRMADELNRNSAAGGPPTSGGHSNDRCAQCNVAGVPLLAPDEPIGMAPSPGSENKPRYCNTCMIGKKVRVFWPVDDSWYTGVVHEYDPSTGEHLLRYEDGDSEWVRIGDSTTISSNAGHSGGGATTGGPVGPPPSSAQAPPPPPQPNTISPGDSASSGSKQAQQHHAQPGHASPDRGVYPPVDEVAMRQQPQGMSSVPAMSGPYAHYGHARMAGQPPPGGMPPHPYHGGAAASPMMYNMYPPQMAPHRHPYGTPARDGSMSEAVVVDDPSPKSGKKGPKAWSKHEDATLLKIVQSMSMPMRWSVVALSLPDRTGKQCRERYVNHLNPRLKTSDWNPVEDATIFHLYNTIGSHWSTMSKVIPGRTDNGIKNRFHNLRRQLEREDGHRLRLSSENDFPDQIRLERTRKFPKNLQGKADELWDIKSGIGVLSAQSVLGQTGSNSKNFFGPFRPPKRNESCVRCGFFVPSVQTGKEICEKTGWCTACTRIPPHLSGNLLRECLHLRREQDPRKREMIEDWDDPSDVGGKGRGGEAKKIDL